MSTCHSGVINEQDRQALLQGADDWNTADQERMQATERRLRVVFDVFFKQD